MAANVQSVALAALLGIACYTDLKRRIIPNTVCVLVALTALISFMPSHLWGFFCALPLFAAAVLKEDSFGGGDIKLVAACGLVLGFWGGIAMLVIAFTTEILFYVGYWVIQKINKRECVKALPLAPFLAVGVLTVQLLS